MAGIKIVDLPNNTLPYTGSEKIPLVQNGETRGGTLSSFVNYLSGALPDGVSGDGSGITDAEAFRVAIELDDGNGNVPMNGFTLEDHTASVLTEGVYAEDALCRLRRHDNATTGGVLVIPQRYTGQRILDLAGLGGASGSVTLLDELQALFSGGAANGDVIEIFGKTSFILDPADLPNVDPDIMGFSFSNPAGYPINFAFWGLSNDTGVRVYHDIREWCIRAEVVADTWAFESPACFAVQQRAAAAGGAATVLTGVVSALTDFGPNIATSVDGVITIPFALAIIEGTALTQGTARITWDLELKVTRV